MSKKKVLIADDQNLFANGIKQLLEDDGDVQITAIVETGDEVLGELNNNCNSINL